MIPIAVSALIGYLLGSLPFGWMVARFHGVDIFQVGSRSSGATNVGRVLGKGPRNLVFTLDLAKGVLAAGWPMLVGGLAGLHAVGGDSEKEDLCKITSLFAAMVGHSFSCFTRFRGGKGVATGAGGFLVILPLPIAICAAVWLSTYLVFRYVSLASILSALALPVAAWSLGRPAPLCLAGTLAGLFVIWRHRANIGRLLQGTENRAGK